MQEQSYNYCLEANYFNRKNIKRTLYTMIVVFTVKIWDIEPLNIKTENKTFKPISSPN